MAEGGGGGQEDHDLVMDGYDDEMELPDDMAEMMESTMEEGDGREMGGGDDDDDDDDYQGQLVEVEPEIYLGSGEQDCDDDFMMEGDSSSNQFFDSFNDSSLGAGFGDVGDGSNDASSLSGRPGSVRKTALGPNCPVCDQVLHRQHARDHVAWHFMDELKEMIADPGSCPDPGCEYVGDKTENVARHLALYHCKLDDFLSDQALVEEKRVKAMTKPKKVRPGRLATPSSPR